LIFAGVYDIVLSMETLSLFEKLAYPIVWLVVIDLFLLMVLLFFGIVFCVARFLGPK